MRSPGRVLRELRELKQINFSTIEHELNLSKNHLEALENDNHDIFPSESYYLGFLRAYAEYLGQDPKVLFEYFENIKLLESPVPLEKLTGRDKRAKNRVVLLLTTLIVVSIIAIALAFFYV